jgi:hypothetical protein
VKDANNPSVTSISPVFEIMKDIKDLSDRGGTDVVGVTPDDVLRNVLLTQTAQKAHVDIVVSNTITVGRYDIPSNHQEVYVINPLLSMKASRNRFYQGETTTQLSATNRVRNCAR